ncbi:hypothetical protein Krad_2829 [Kineococcus radiotolerans SRS30216 = ATCC BAA-149]|uniref:Uncharacterized protein n=1 Tax=Kineococcus radiotolerans (strain ATCC BAA-149 / DSM 14245 / SRS30216) TaxID=266940 RepID=A6WBV8_KINRD|nr:hypothetical protein Krad_2829 [Kineococcus radiotolerans SRS30216 = ATCC BAA-149]
MRADAATSHRRSPVRQSHVEDTISSSRRRGDPIGVQVLHRPHVGVLRVLDPPHLIEQAHPPAQDQPRMRGTPERSLQARVGSPPRLSPVSRCKPSPRT